MSTLKEIRWRMPAAALGQENPLPDLGHVGDAHAAIEVDHTTVTEEESRYMGWGRINSILPYQLQDGYGRQRH